VYLHGIQSHPGWFVGSAASMADRGHAVFQVTRRGSGENVVDRGHARSAGQLLDDVAAAIRFAKDQTGADAVHLAGVSWGGKLAAAYAADASRAGDVASLTLIAPGIAAQVDVPLRTKLAIGASLLCCPKRRFDIPLSDVDLFTDNEPMRQYLRDDPFRLHRATARFLFISRLLDRSLRRTPPGAITAPTTLLLATRDRIIDNPATESTLHRLAPKHLTVHTLDGAHTLEFESDPTPLHAALADALNPA
jgi:acylglycerol lipase